MGFKTWSKYLTTYQKRNFRANISQNIPLIIQGVPPGTAAIDIWHLIRRKFKIRQFAEAIQSKLYKIISRPQ